MKQIIIICVPLIILLFAGWGTLSDRLLLLRLSDGQKVDQMFMVSIDGHRAITADEVSFLRRCQPGAVLLFGPNVRGSVSDVRELTASIQKAVKDTPLPPLIAIDHEGGVVNRFGERLTPLPSARGSASCLSSAQMKLLGRYAGRELRGLGISVNLAPVVEPAGNWNRDFLGSRSFSEDPEICVSFATSFAAGLRSGGCAATLKHFPGNASGDPHRSLPVWSAELKDIERYGIDVFRRAIPASKVQLVMLSHAVVPAIDGKYPASLSVKCTGILRRKLHFDGVVLCDDLMMKALADRWSPDRSAVMAFNAGSDMVIISSRRDYLRARQSVLSALESGAISRARLNASVLRIITLKRSLGLRQERSASSRNHRFSAVKHSVKSGTQFLQKNGCR